MAHLVESPSVPPINSPLIQRSHMIDENLSLSGAQEEKTITVAHQCVPNPPKQSRRRSKSDPSFDNFSRNGTCYHVPSIIKQNQSDKMTPVPEVDTAYLATPSTFSPDDNLLRTPLDQENGSSDNEFFSPIFPTIAHEAYHREASVKSELAVNSVHCTNALGIFQVFEGVEVLGNDQGETKSQVDGNGLNTVAREGEIEDFFQRIWTTRRPEDCRIFFQASNVCHLNGSGKLSTIETIRVCLLMPFSFSECPMCDNDTLMGSYQCATTMKPFPQASINALLKRPPGGKLKRSEKKMVKSLAQTHSAYPLSGTLPYLHPVTTLEVCLLCVTPGCSMKEFKLLDRGAFVLRE